MNVAELKKRIAALKRGGAKRIAEIQAVGLGCLEQVELHGNTTPINDLIGALSRPETKAFTEWALAFGKVKKASKADAEKGQFLAYDKARTTDMVGAAEQTWDTFAPEKKAAVQRAFDLQASVMQILRKAAEAGQSQSVIDAIAKAAGIEHAPRTVMADVDAAPF